MKNKKDPEEENFKYGVFELACPFCGNKELYAHYDTMLPFYCRCGHTLWLKRRYLDRNCTIVYGMYLDDKY
jgi:hypothetical protein